MSNGRVVWLVVGLLLCAAIGLTRHPAHPRRTRRATTKRPQQQNTPRTTCGPHGTSSEAERRAEAEDANRSDRGVRMRGIESDAWTNGAIEGGVGEWSSRRCERKTRHCSDPLQPPAIPTASPCTSQGNICQSDCHLSAEANQPSLTSPETAPFS